MTFYIQLYMYMYMCILQKSIPYKEMHFIAINMLGFLPKLIQNINIVYFKESYWNGIGILVYPFLNLNSRLLS